MANRTKLVAGLEAKGVRTVSIAYSSKWNGGFVPFDQGIGHFQCMPKQTQKILLENPQLNFSACLDSTSLVAFKNSCSVYQEPSIANFVEREEISLIILSGLFEEGLFGSDQCCLSETARDFVGNGYNVLVAAEVTNRGIEEDDGFLPLPVRQANFDRFAQHGSASIHVTPTNQILACLAAGN